MLMQFSNTIEKRERERNRNKKLIDAEKSGRRKICSSLKFNYKHNHYVTSIWNLKIVHYT